MPIGVYDRPTPIQRLMKNVKITKHNCWIWQKLKTKNGWPLIWIEGCERRADRYALNLAHGIKDYESRDKLTTLKTCGHNSCCNPQHMMLVPKRILHRNSLKTHCKHGHEFSEHNTYIDASGFRHCRACITNTNHKRRGAPGAKKRGRPKKEESSPTETHQTHS